MLCLPLQQVILLTLSRYFSCTDSSQQPSNGSLDCLEYTMAAIMAACSTGGRVAARLNKGTREGRKEEREVEHTVLAEYV